MEKNTKQMERNGMVKGALMTVGAMALAAGAGYLGLKYSWSHEKNRYSEGWAKFEDGTMIYDKDLADFVKKHLKLLDRLDTRKVVESSALGFVMLEGGTDIPEGDDWKF